MTNAERLELILATIEARLQGGAIDAIEIDGVNIALMNMAQLLALEAATRRLAEIDARNEEGTGVSYAGFGRMR